MIFISARQNIYKTNEFVREKLFFHPTPICPPGQAVTVFHYTSSRAFCHLEIPSPANRCKVVDSRRNLHDSAPRNLKLLARISAPQPLESLPAGNTNVRRILISPNYLPEFPAAVLSSHKDTTASPRLVVLQNEIHSALFDCCR